MYCDRCGKIMGTVYFAEIYNPMFDKHETYRICFGCCHQHYIRSREWLHPDRVPEACP